jgi:8-oxo-dGTP pyrophosphatase MutT (NUDIX family)
MSVHVATTPELAPSNRLDDAVAHVESVIAPSLQPVQHQMVTFAAAHANALDRSCVLGHFTGSALVLDTRAGRVLLLHHAKLRRWLQPGGHADGNGNLAAVALREATEETGIEGLRVVLPAIDLDVHLVEPPREGAHHHYDVRFLVLAPAGAIARGNHESTALRWVRLDELDSLACDQGIRRMAEAALAACAVLPA